MSFKLVNVVKLKEKKPNTTFVPSELVIRELKKGDQVKLNFVTDSLEGGYGCEELWVVISKRKWNLFTGTLINQPKKIKCLVMGQKISFGAEHICHTEFVDGAFLQINNYIQIRLEPNDCTTATTEVEYLIEFENDYLSFVIDEHDPEELKINMKS